MTTTAFPLGLVVATPAALELLSRCNCSPSELLARHASGDWGDLAAADAQRNKAALKDGSRILSSYQVNGETIWIITEAADDVGQRAATTLLLPSEY